MTLDEIYPREVSNFFIQDAHSVVGYCILLNIFMTHIPGGGLAGAGIEGGRSRGVPNMGQWRGGNLLLVGLASVWEVRTTAAHSDRLAHFAIGTGPADVVPGLKRYSSATKHPA